MCSAITCSPAIRPDRGRTRSTRSRVWCSSFPNISEHVSGEPMDRPPLPPFTQETAAQKARMAEDAWNSRDPVRVSGAYTADSRWRNRAEFFQGTQAIQEFLTRKWARELDYRLIKEVWAFAENRIAAR